MLELGVQTGIHWQPNHLLTIYTLDNNELPVTESLFPRLLTLPLHLDLSNEDIKFVCNSLSSQLL
jgi:dTDP-4-amino-4,6-dideoxygalactose transaminase